jgi:hypothetical protein
MGPEFNCWNPLLQDNGIQGFLLLRNNGTSADVQERPKVAVGRYCARMTQDATMALDHISVTVTYVA